MDVNKKDNKRLIIDINNFNNVNIDEISNIKNNNSEIWKNDISDVNKLIEYGQKDIDAYLQALENFVDKISNIPILQTEYTENIIAFSIDTYMVTIANGLLKPLLLNDYENSFIEDKDLFDEIRKSILRKLNDKYNK